MEKNFQEQIQRIHKLRDLYEANLMEESERKKELEEIQEKELKRFKEHVQRKFIEYTLNLFEEYTAQYGKIDKLGFLEEVEDVRFIGQKEATSFSDAKKRTNKRIIIFDKDEKYEYRSLYWSFHGNNMKNGKIDFSHFYSDYVPQVDFAHVFITDFEHPNIHSCSICKPYIVLYIDNMKDLFDAVKVNYNCTKHYMGNWDYGGFEITTLNLDDQMKIELFAQKYNKTRPDLTVELLNKK